MRAVRLTAARSMELVDVAPPEPSPDEVVVRVSACGICGSDLSCFKTGLYAGSVLGHEFSGVVETVGDAGSPFSAGQQVLVDPKLPCGQCADCISGATYRCAIGLTHAPGGTRDGGLAEMVAVPSYALHALPDGLPLEDGCLTEPLAVAIHGVERGLARSGEDALVVGLGPIGLLTIAALRARGAGTITGIDPVEIRRDLARRLGADRVEASLATAPGGAPLVFECTGRPDVLQDATNVAAGGGRVVLLGVPLGEATVSPLPWVVREISVIGSIASSRDDFVAAADLLVRERSIARIITSRVSLAEVPAVFEELVTAPGDGKVVALPNS